MEALARDQANAQREIQELGEAGDDRCGANRRRQSSSFQGTDHSPAASARPAENWLRLRVKSKTLRAKIKRIEADQYTAGPTRNDSIRR